MVKAIDEQVKDFYEELFRSIFADPFQSQISERLKRNDMARRVEESADAASQSLTRFFLNQGLSEQQAAAVLRGFAPIRDNLSLESISNPNVTTEAVVQQLLPELTVPSDVRNSQLESTFRVAVHSVVQVLMLVGPVMAEWQKLNHATTFELLSRVISRLNQISVQIDAIGRSGQDAFDDRYELSYRDYLLQRFYQVEAGTVRMTTNLNVDLRQLFVMPRVSVRATEKRPDGPQPEGTPDLMDLAAARLLFRGNLEPTQDDSPEQTDNARTALEQVRNSSRTVFVGAPGSGKSTFFEWLQLQVAAVEEELVLADQQAIPV